MSTKKRDAGGSQGNPLIRFREEPETLGRIAKASARFTVAEKRSIGHPDVQRRALLFGLACFERCPRCVAELPCDVHGAEAIDALSRPPERPPAGPAAPAEPPPAPASVEPAGGASRAQGDPSAGEPDPWGLAPEAPEPSSAKRPETPREATIRIYFESYRGVHGVDPTFRGREGKAIDDLIRELRDAEEAQRRIRVAYADPVWAKRRQTTILQIAGNPAAFASSAPAGATSTRQQPPATGRTWRRSREVEV